jgi:hypothetical protein
MSWLKINTWIFFGNSSNFKKISSKKSVHSRNWGKLKNCKTKIKHLKTLKIWIKLISTRKIRLDQLQPMSSSEKKNNPCQKVYQREVESAHQRITTCKGNRMISVDMSRVKARIYQPRTKTLGLEQDSKLIKMKALKRK